MHAHILDAGVIVGTIEVTDLNFMPGLIDAALGGSKGDIWDGTTFHKPTQDLEVLRTAKDKQITAWRLAADDASFTFQGHHIAADLASKIQITMTNSEILNGGGVNMPVRWVGGWKTMINTAYVPIPDVATWNQFHSACFNQGLSNFTHAQTLKATLAAATTVAQIEAIVW